MDDRTYVFVVIWRDHNRPSGLGDLVNPQSGHEVLRCTCTEGDECVRLTLLLLHLLPSLWCKPCAAYVGDLCRRKVRPLRSEERADFDVLRAAALTLLGLIVGFSFAMAVSRYDQRKNLEEAEANAIGTEYLRADLLPAESAAKVRELLGKYVEQRIAFYLARHDQVDR